MSNHEKFKQFLKVKDIELEEDMTDDNKKYFVAYHNISSGPRVRIVIVFADDDKAVTIYGFNYVSVEDSSKRPLLLGKTNELNYGYLFTRFLVDDENNVTTKTFSPLFDAVDPEFVWDLICSVAHALEEEFKDFMKIVWG